MVGLIHGTFLSDFWLLLLGVFLLGTYIVATIDDIKYMAATKSFTYVWLGIAAVLAVVHFFADAQELVLRLILTLVIYILFHFNILKFKLAIGDIFAMMPALFLLPLLYAILFIAVVMLVDRILLKTYYHKFRKRTQYPFMPAILSSLLITLLLFYIISLSPLLSSASLDVVDGENTETEHIETEKEETIEPDVGESSSDTKTKDIKDNPLS